MRIWPCILALLLAAIPSLGQQSSQTPASDSSQNQSQSQSQPQDSQSQNQDQSQTPADKSQSAPADRKRLPLGKQPSAADENPFPEDISRKAADKANGTSDSDAPEPKTGKSSGDQPKPDAPNYSSSRTHLEDIGTADDNESRISNGAGGYILNPTLAAQDVKVGGFYLKTGDYKGAYTRYKEATEVNPENADAVFGLAEAARGLKLKDEAANNYRLYLDAVPDGSKSKAARKALAELGAGPKK
jgi:tetratricopeptide (TPR) repeat protein